MLANPDSSKDLEAREDQGTLETRGGSPTELSEQAGKASKATLGI